MTVIGLLRFVAVAVLLLTAVSAAWSAGFWPAFGWFAAAVATSKILPEDA